jgi:hypothetical protein
VVSARCEEARVETTTERSGKRGWNSMAAWFRCGSEGIGAGRSCGGESEDLVPFIGQRRRGVAGRVGEMPSDGGELQWGG